MNPDVAVATIAAVGGVVTTMLEVLRRQAKRTEHAIATPGDGTAGELLAGLAGDVKEIEKVLTKHGERMAIVETRLSDHLLNHGKAA